VKKVWRVKENSVDKWAVLRRKLDSCRNDLKCWARMYDGKKNMDIQNLEESLQEMQKEGDPRKLEIEKLLKEELDNLLEVEALKWRQRAKEDWLKYGDRNTKYFHACGSQKIRKNLVKEIADLNGMKWTSQKDIEWAFIDYFQWLYGAENYKEVDCCTRTIIFKVTRQMKQNLTAFVLMEEIQIALNQLAPLKAPRPDGFPTFFFQQNWEILHQEVCDAIKYFFDTGNMDTHINSTVIALIPKMKNPKFVTEFRPISLCNVVYKILSKVLANMLKIILPDIISSRLIIDNIIAAYETMHIMQTRMWSKTGYMGIKLDISKAYDRVEWSFLEAVMYKLGFADAWIKLIMNCVKSVNYSVVVNGNVVGNIIPSRGIRQGDPISPYLFILCAKAFSSLLQHAYMKGTISGVPTSKNGPKIIHLFFADDSLIFCKANQVEWRRLLNILDIYERGYGQKINLNKTVVFFSCNTCLSRRQEILALSGLSEANRYDSYLGLPTLVGKNRINAFKEIKERVIRKLNNWKAKLLTLAAKEILLKAVVQAIPTYSMSVFLLPISLCKDLNRLMQSFWWVHLSNDSKIHWMSWSKMGRSKTVGGLGFRDLIMFNKAFLAKQCWRLIQNPDSLIAQTIRAKYYPNSSFMELELGK
jgi:hypothetical protein